MTSSTDLGGGLGGAFAGPGRLANGVGEGLEVVGRGTQRLRVRGEPDDLPAAWHRQALGVLGAQVVTVRLGVGSQWSEHRGRLGVDVGEGGHGRTRASRSRTLPQRAHEVGSYRSTIQAMYLTRSLSLRDAGTGHAGPVPDRFWTGSGRASAEFAACCESGRTGTEHLGDHLGDPATSGVMVPTSCSAGPHAAGRNRTLGTPARCPRGGVGAAGLGRMVRGLRPHKLRP